MEAKQCAKCCAVKSLENFYKNSRGGRIARCSKCTGEAVTAYRKTEAGREMLRKRERRRNKTPAGKARRKRAAIVRRERDRKLVFDHYGRECAECGSTENLTVDHIKQDAARAGVKRTSKSCNYYATSDDLRRWLVRNDFPEEFRVLCMRHNHMAYWLHAAGFDVSGNFTKDASEAAIWLREKKFKKWEDVA